MSVGRRREIVEPAHPRLSIVRQCELVSISRSAFYGQVKGESALNLELMQLIDAQLLEHHGMAAARWRAICGGLAMRLAASGCGD